MTQCDACWNRLVEASNLAAARVRAEIMDAARKVA